MKSLFKYIYYAIYNNKKIAISGSIPSKGKKWIINDRYGRAYFKGYYEPKISGFISNNLSKNSVFIDVGSHAGYFSLIAASCITDGHVYSFEPDSENYQFIQNIKAINHISHWSIEALALSDSTGSLQFKSNTFSSMGKIDKNGDLTVSSTTLDEYVRMHNIQGIDMIKIDVEGHGGNVLKGAINSIIRFRPKILLEVHSGSEELEIASDLLSSLYIFEDFENESVIHDHNSNKVDFVLLTPKQEIYITNK